MMELVFFLATENYMRRSGCNVRTMLYFLTVSISGLDSFTLEFCRLINRTVFGLPKGSLLIFLFRVPRDISFLGDSNPPFDCSERLFFIVED